MCLDIWHKVGSGDVYEVASSEQNQPRYLKLLCSDICQESAKGKSQSRYGVPEQGLARRVAPMNKDSEIAKLLGYLMHRSSDPRGYSGLRVHYECAGY